MLLGRRSADDFSCACPGFDRFIAMGSVSWLLARHLMRRASHQREMSRIPRKRVRFFARRKPAVGRAANLPGSSGSVGCVHAGLVPWRSSISDESGGGAVGGTEARVLALLGEVSGLLDIEEFRDGLLSALRSEVACNYVSLN